MRGKRKKDVIEEYLRGGTSYRELGSKYGVSSSTLQRWVEAAGRDKTAGAESGFTEKAKEAEKAEGADPTAEIRRLREELRRERLHNELLNAMIDIAEEQFEIPIRKKRGAKR